MSCHSEYRTLPSGLSLDRHTESHGMEVETEYYLSYDLMGESYSCRITKEEYDALYPLSKEEVNE